MKFNINDRVRVRLTDLGRKQHKKDDEAFFGKLRHRYPYVAPAEDADGWSEWQLWCLMAAFGNYMGNGSPLMFETEIEIPIAVQTDHHATGPSARPHPNAQEPESPKPQRPPECGRGRGQTAG